MHYIKFNDEIIDSMLMMELSDLAQTLTKRRDIDIAFAVQSYFHPAEQKIYISHFWNDRAEEDKLAGFKSDIYLRAIGSYYYTDFHQIAAFHDLVRTLHHQKFAKQLLMLLEDVRIEELVKRDRPGTKRYFRKRLNIYKKYYRDQLKASLDRGFATDALFAALYEMATATSPVLNVPEISVQIDELLPFVKEQVMNVYDANSTKEVSDIVLKTMRLLDEVLKKDLIHTYFILPDLSEKDLHTLTFDDMKRKDRLQNQDALDNVKKGDEDLHDEKMAVWHRETSTPTKSFLQFDLEQGTQTNLIDEHARQTETGDQALVIVEGSARQTQNNYYDEVNADEKLQKEAEQEIQQQLGKENKHAKAYFLKANMPKEAEKSAYEKELQQLIVYKKRLQRIIQKTLEHKKTYPKQDEHFGRLNKKLLRLWTDENPKLFFKKRNPANDLDGVFTLLVDCSASMHDKMEETKRGIILFHETLKSVRVPHQIVGFWEDSANSTENNQPNYFKKVINFETSLSSSSGPEIMQLLPEEDNRDGFAIRHMTNELLARKEKQKFLLVFSDGEPAAYGYDQNGIVDTHEAVMNARKHGIEVLNIFLSAGAVEESKRKVMKTIYGKHSIMVQNITELPDVLFPLLKKLLQKTIE